MLSQTLLDPDGQASSMRLMCLLVVASSLGAWIGGMIVARAYIEPGAGLVGLVGAALAAKAGQAGVERFSRPYGGVVIREGMDEPAPYRTDPREGS